MNIISRGSILDLTYPQVMGILNVTPDSFSDGGCYNQLGNALTYADKMVQAGATIIDVGGESTRPNATEICAEEELNRVIPVVEALAKHIDVWISVDTSKSVVIREAVAAGAHLINDIRALREPDALEVAATTNVPICLMHMQGEPPTMQKNPTYDDIIDAIKCFFIEQIDRCVAAGIDKKRLILDPGFGFGKTLAHNYQLLARLAEFHYLGLPLLVGMSRKSMIGQLLGVAAEQRLTGSLACAVIAAMKGAQIIRVHDVKETVNALRVVQATLSAIE